MNCPEHPVCAHAGCVKCAIHFDRHTKRAYCDEHAVENGITPELGVRIEIDRRQEDEDFSI